VTGSRDGGWKWLCREDGDKSNFVAVLRGVWNNSCSIGSWTLKADFLTVHGDASLQSESESEMRAGMAGMDRAIPFDFAFTFAGSTSLSDVFESEQRLGMPERSGLHAGGAGGGVILLNLSARRFACRLLTGVVVSCCEIGVEGGPSTLILTMSFRSVAPPLTVNRCSSVPLCFGTIMAACGAPWYSDVPGRGDSSESESGGASERKMFPRLCVGGPGFHSIPTRRNIQRITNF